MIKVWAMNLLQREDIFIEMPLDSVPILQHHLFYTCKFFLWHVAKKLLIYCSSFVWKWLQCSQQYHCWEENIKRQVSRGIGKIGVTQEILLSTTWRAFKQYTDQGSKFILKSLKIFDGDFALVANFPHAIYVHA